MPIDAAIADEICFGTRKYSASYLDGLYQQFPRLRSALALHKCRYWWRVGRTPFAPHATNTYGQAASGGKGNMN
jgi:hypothetical protein